MNTRRKKAIIFVGLAAIFFVTVVFFVPPILNVDRYRPQIVAYLERVSGKKAEIGHLTLTIFPKVTIRVDDLGLKNPTEFPEGYFVAVKRIDAELAGRSLLHRQVIIKTLVMENPVINLISDPDGPWNFENPKSEAPGNIFSLGKISTVDIKGGQLSVSNLLLSDEPGVVFFEAHNISGRFEQVDLRAFTDPDSSTTSPSFLGAEGNLKTAALRFGSIHAKDVSSKIRLQARDVFFTDVRGETYGGSAAGDVSFDLAGKNPSFKTNARIKGINVAQLLATFPGGRGKMTGKMEGEVKLAGEIQHSTSPWVGIHGAGQVTVRDGQVPSLKLNANLVKLVHFNDLGPAKLEPSSFSFISTDWELANQQIFSRRIDIDGYGVDVDGSGSISVNGSEKLNYQGTAKITTNQSFFKNVLARLSGATLQDGKLSFPFRVSGTLQNPIFSEGKEKGD